MHRLQGVSHFEEHYDHFMSSGSPTRQKESMKTGATHSGSAVSDLEIKFSERDIERVIGNNYLRTKILRICSPERIAPGRVIPGKYPTSTI